MDTEISKENLIRLHLNDNSNLYLKNPYDKHESSMGDIELENSNANWSQVLSHNYSKVRVENN